MADLKKFLYQQKDFTGEITFQTSVINEIDAEKYSLFEILYNEKLGFLSFRERIAILNSWLTDNNRTHMAFDRRIAETGCKTIATVKNTIIKQEQNLLNLSSNDYLKLTQHPKIKQAVIEAIRMFGLGAGAASFATGTTRLHRQLEEKIAQFKGCEDSLVYSSGYGANVGVISSLLGENDIGIFDAYAHASLLDGMSLAHTNKVFFLHNDMNSLEYMLKRAQRDYINKLVIVEGVYSMDGDIAPLDKIVELAHKYDAWLLVDEAHATGVLGKTGKGTIEHYHLEGQVDVVTGTFSKAVGGIGGFVAGTKNLIDYFRFSSRSYLFATAAFIPAVAAALEAFNIIEQEPELRKRLWDNTHYMHQKLTELGFDIGKTQTCIIPIYIGNDTKVLELTQQLQNKGFLVNPAVYPGVPKEKARIRLAVTSGNTKEQLDSFLNSLCEESKALA